MRRKKIKKHLIQMKLFECFCLKSNNDASIALLEELNEPYEELLYRPEKTMRDVQDLMTDLYYSSNDDKINELLKELYEEDPSEYNEQVEVYTLSNPKDKQHFIWEKLSECAYGKLKDNSATKAWNNLKLLEEKWATLNSAFYTPLQGSIE